MNAIPVVRLTQSHAIAPNDGEARSGCGSADRTRRGRSQAQQAAGVAVGHQPQNDTNPAARTGPRTGDIAACWASVRTFVCRRRARFGAVWRRAFDMRLTHRAPPAAAPTEAFCPSVLQAGEGRPEPQRDHQGTRSHEHQSRHTVPRFDDWNAGTAKSARRERVTPNDRAVRSVSRTRTGGIGRRCGVKAGTCSDDPDAVCRAECRRPASAGLRLGVSRTCHRWLATRVAAGVRPQPRDSCSDGRGYDLR